MARTKKIEEKVFNFIGECSKEIGKFSDCIWNVNLWNECQDLNMTSPIEQILYCALKTIRRLNFIKSAEPYRDGDVDFIQGLEVKPQFSINKYRVDFLVGNYVYDKETKTLKEREVVVECDSQQFHDRSEPERRYEKQRDRFLQARGYKIFHYTGAEILKNPFVIAREIIAYITEIPEDELLLDSNWRD